MRRREVVGEDGSVIRCFLGVDVFECVLGGERHAIAPHQLKDAHEHQMQDVGKDFPELLVVHGVSIDAFRGETAIVLMEDAPFARVEESVGQPPQVKMPPPELHFDGVEVVHDDAEADGLAQEGVKVRELGHDFPIRDFLDVLRELPFNDPEHLLRLRPYEAALRVLGGKFLNSQTFRH